MNLSNTCNIRHSRRASRSIAAGVLLSALLAGVGGCESAFDRGVKKLFAPRPTPQAYMLIAVSDQDPDARRDAVVRVAESKLAREEWAIKGYVAIATLETDPQARCVAVRALARVDDPRAAETLLKILNYSVQPTKEVRPPDDLCRWDATAGLGVLAAREAIPDELQELARETFRRLLRTDPDRHVRLHAARALEHYPTDEVVLTLIRALRDPDFAVVHACEDSLVTLTGNTNRCEAYAWEQWYAAHEGALFAQAGQIPPERQLPYDNRWEKFAWETGQVIEWLWPGADKDR